MAKRKAPAAANPVAPKSATPAEYTVVARRYRPQQFADLVGQEPVAQALENALKSGRIAHAYLFTGTRGVGKTTTARILAKALNCVNGPTPTPCDKCESCVAIAAGQDVDVLEIDGASNRGIDNIRELRQNVQFRPSRSRYKIYIIDEVHQITRDAFNALLKTLEEPPPHVKFVFATTDVQKVPITILSRCQRFDFTGISSPQIIERLKDVVQAEGVKADDDALELLARRAGGSMRDAQSLLDQLLAFGGDRLTIEKVHRLLGTADEDQVAALAAAVLSKDAPLALKLLSEGVDRGLQIGELLDQLIDYWRDLMLLAGGGPNVTGLNASSRHRDA
ncbi:MAG TPA: DNA polymerase III subunit gamma/tau, partial [Gemmataceae bacterium]|nr:DNA polymerase III subunit gamma/tau [Gemmataceae bacterium]